MIYVGMKHHELFSIVNVTLSIDCRTKRQQHSALICVTNDVFCGKFQFIKTHYTVVTIRKISQSC